MRSILRCRCVGVVCIRGTPRNPEILHQRSSAKLGCMGRFPAQRIGRRLVLRGMAACGVAPVLSPLGALAAECTSESRIASRELAVGTAGGLRVGLKSYPQTLPLADREVVLTFDDGPIPGPTSRVLDTLACHGVRATFFVIGRNAVANAALAPQDQGGGPHRGLPHLVSSVDACARCPTPPRAGTSTPASTPSPRCWENRPRPFSGFPGSPTPLPCSHGWHRAISACSAATCGRPTGRR